MTGTFHIAPETTIGLPAIQRCIDKDDDTQVEDDAFAVSIFIQAWCSVEFHCLSYVDRYSVIFLLVCAPFCTKVSQFDSRKR